MDEKRIAERVAAEHEKLDGIVQSLRTASAEIPARDRGPWLEQLRERFFHFRAHMNHRIALEEIGGFLNHVLEARPTAARDVEHLRREHRDILALIEEVQQGLADVGADDTERLKHVRMRIAHVLSAVHHHTEHEDLLVSFIHTQDIGGES